MTDSLDARLPDPVVRKRRRVSPALIWLVPILAAVAGVVLIVRAYLAAGPSIVIRFDTAEGLQAGATKVLYKNVVIGEVSAIDLTKDRSGVRAHVDLNREVEDVAVEDSQFWVVRARADLGGISGIKTLVTGTYIGVNVGKSDQASRSFVGLEKPPAVTNDQKGRQFVLTSDDLGSISNGSPIYFRRFPVGRIVGFELFDGGRSVKLSAFVDAPYDALVTDDARFWNASGVDLSLDASGLKVDTQSLVTLLAGGVSFFPQSGKVDGQAAVAGAEFTLYPSRGAAMTPRDASALPVRMRFFESTRGLFAGAEVDFRGVGLGRITGVEPSFDAQRKRFVADVSADLYPTRLGRAYEEFATEDHAQGATAEALFTRLIKRGLSAQMRSGNLITGQIYVALDFAAAGKLSKVDSNARPLQIPTQPASLDQIQSRIADIITKVDRIPFEDIGLRLRDALGSADSLLRQMDKDVAPAATATLRNAQATLDSANRSLAAPGAPLQQDLHRTLDEVDRAARSLRDLSDYLQRHPESLIRGRRGGEEASTDE